MSTRIPFMFYDDTNKKYLVYRATYSYSRYSGEHMCDEHMGNDESILEPSVDITEEVFEFRNEAQAIQKMKDLWNLVRV